MDMDFVLPLAPCRAISPDEGDPPPTDPKGGGARGDEEVKPKPKPQPKE